VRRGLQPGWQDAGLGELGYNGAAVECGAFLRGSSDLRYVNRNLSVAEWKRYLGTDVRHRKTGTELAAGEGHSDKRVESSVNLGNPVRLALN
jgi:hypothetical protein